MPLTLRARLGERSIAGVRARRTSVPSSAKECRRRSSWRSSGASRTRSTAEDHAHEPPEGADEQNASKARDTVRIVETRPLSKDKRWRVVEILERAR